MANENQASQKTSYKLPQKISYFFAAGETDGNAGMKNILGGKGANLAEMTSLGLPVPPGFTISTECCQAFYDNGEKLPQEVISATEESMARLEKIIGKKFASQTEPLLVSVRSGSRASMPGMMDTILNLGLNDQTVEALATGSGNPRFAWDAYRRFLQMYSNVVMGMNSSLLDIILEDLKHDKNIKNDTELTVDDLKFVVGKYKNQIQESTGRQFPMDPKEQLIGAISAVFKSWNTARAVTYRELHGYPNDWGTAVNVQAMVFGNMGDDSATGVAFTRNPSTGEKKFYGEFMVNAQGEDVVAGIRTPSEIQELEKVMPQAYGQLIEIYQKLESYFRDMQDIEFTIEKGVLYMLQTRNGKRTAKAALKVARDMIEEKLISEEEAILRIDPMSLDQLLHPTLDPHAPRTKLTRGLPASPGAAVGQIVFTSEETVEWTERGKKVILVRVETSPEDISGMVKAQGILTTRGGMTSHAAVVARGMGKCCVAGSGEIYVDYKAKTMRVNDYVLKEGDWITLDGSTGEVFMGEVKTVEPSIDENFSYIMKLSDKFRTLGVRANADTPLDAKTSCKFGAEGIGLCRTEHMFFNADRIDVVRQMILADERDERLRALEALLPMQRGDFEMLLGEMDGLPVTIRFLDPPLHEFLPQSENEIREFSKRTHADEAKVKAKIRNLHELNPMLGHRGCRLAISYPEIYQMQARAVAEATINLIKKGKKPQPEIMIPLVGMKEELKRLRRLVEVEVERVQAEMNQKFDYLIGTMIELPRAALTADQIAEHADFFSFGTNDLTQTTLGLSRDDSARFLSTYVSDGILSADPFQTIDRSGVGQLVKKAVEFGKKTKPDIKLGICGEHGGDPKSIEFFNEVGLNYVSCSPYRLPIARLAAARAAIQHRGVAH
ncbi:MAG: pyruvate, phosphate dikinase [Bdellovibrionales bacterium]|nr:pyruvate, phosphate dikinase [Bdellovibrionales bacterium]